MGLPNPIDVIKATAEVYLGPQVWLAQQGAHVTKATAKRSVDTLDSIPANVSHFITFPLRMLQAGFNVGFWVLGHLEWIFWAGVLVLLAILARFLFTAFKAAESRITDTVKGKSRPQRRTQAVEDNRQAPHRQNVVEADGTLCVRGGVREARHVGRRSGGQDVFQRGRCRVHNGSHLYEVV